MPLNGRTGQLDKVHLLCSIDIAMVHSQWKVGSIKSSTQEMVNPEFLFGTSTLPAHPDDNYGPINWQIGASESISLDILNKTQFFAN